MEKIIEEIAKKEQLTKNQCRRVIGLYISHLTKMLSQEGIVKINTIGVLKIKERKPRMIWDMWKKEKVMIPGKKVVVFKPSKVLLQKLNYTDGTDNADETPE